MLASLLMRSLKSSLIFSEVDKDYINSIETTMIGIASTGLNDIVVEKVKYKKRALLILEGVVPSYLYFMDDGSLARFYFHVGKKEHTTGFVTEYDIACCYSDMILRRPATCNLQMLTTSYVYRVKWDDILKLTLKYPVLKSLESLIYACNLQFIQQQSNSLRMLSARERYVWLTAARRDIVRYAPIAYLAQYLGVSPECLSRIRAELRTGSENYVLKVQSKYNRMLVNI